MTRPRSSPAARWLCAAAALCVVAASDAGRARAQDAGGTSAAPGARVVAAQVAIVGGNSAGARERALDEALRQAVDQALADQLDAATRAAQARAIKTLEARARSYIRRYRTIDEGEANGQYSVRVEAEVDDEALRRAVDRWTAPAAPATAAAPPSRAGGASLMLVVSGPPDAGPAVTAALAAAGVKARPGDASLADPARAVQAAARAALPAVAFVSVTVTDEGIVRGPGQIAVACQLAAKLVAAPGGATLGEPSASLRSFADSDAAARADCLARAAAAIAPRLAPSTGPAAAPAGDLRVVAVDADVTEPGSVAALLRAVRGVGSVSSAEIRRVTPGRAELRVRTRLAAPALAAALSRDTSTVIILTNVEAAGDLVRLRARLRPPPAPPAAASPPATTTP
jgi:hypothetical protein